MNNKDQKIAIIGSGALGTSLGKVLYDNKYNNIVVYGVDDFELKELKEGKNTHYFPTSTSIPKFNTTNDLKNALQNASYVIIAVPSKVVDKVYPQIISLLSNEVLIINGAKGFYPNTNFSLHHGMEKNTKNNPFVRSIVSLIGPSHAEEIIKAIPTIVTAVNKNIDLCLEVQKLFTNDYFKVYAQTDVKGAMAASAYKNVLAIASGIAFGLGGGINTTAALLTRGLVEMQIFVKSQGGKSKTVMGLTGIGDLIVTATSDLSRNYTMGKEIAKNGIGVINNSKTTVEGLEALKFINKIKSF